MCDVDGIGPFTSEHQLCDDEGVVGGAFLELHNRLRAMRHREPVLEPFQCTSHAHLAGEHIRCTSPAHDAPVPGWADDGDPLRYLAVTGPVSARDRAWAELTAAPITISG